ncbi:hypothetical protein G7Y89_g5876 [Cudoniella acicularis]|uniref:Heterokaryon incompatibility domain-containing protein n=1 Tax=Cudoniella acicularis TaxID=354080 RepID=A0A8H4RNY5_9HELO|nr:hypothetical protein G7Y89_g5876 [Cudoniella acicularis]
MALSYVWGDASNLKTIRVNDIEVKITVNLHHALRDIRDQTRELFLWADTICINQNYDGENNHQVGMMSKIYVTAHHTIIYLGNFDAGIEDISDTSNAVSRTLAATKILRSPWFSRVWVFQELVLSKDLFVQCEKRRWRWKCFYKFVEQNIPPEQLIQGTPFLSLADPEWQSPKLELVGGGGVLSRIHAKVYTYSAEMTEAFRLLVQINQALEKHKRSQPSSLLELVISRKGLGASDPRDIIWAQLDLALDGQYMPFQADYKRITCGKLYNDFHTYSTETERVEELASWVPDWSHLTSAWRLIKVKSSVTLPNFPRTEKKHFTRAEPISIISTISTSKPPSFHVAYGGRTRLVRYIDSRPTSKFHAMVQENNVIALIIILHISAGIIVGIFCCTRIRITKVVSIPGGESSESELYSPPSPVPPVPPQPDPPGPRPPPPGPVPAPGVNQRIYPRPNGRGARGQRIYPRRGGGGVGGDAGPAGRGGQRIYPRN